MPTALLLQAVALFGSLIMPHNIYLHSALVRVWDGAGEEPMRTTCGGPGLVQAGPVAHND